MPTTQPLEPPPPKIVERAFVTDGLIGQDDNIDMLEQFFMEMQKVTVETSQPDDFLSFATCAHFFGVVMLETTTIPVLAEEASDDEEFEAYAPAPSTPREAERRMEDAEESVYPASSRGTTPPGSSAPSVTSYHTTQPVIQDELNVNSSSSDPVMSEQEKVLLWREAFMAKLEQSSNEPIPPSNVTQTHEQPIYSGKGKFPEFYSGFRDHGQTGALLNPFQGSDEDSSDLINWPDEGSSNPSGFYDPSDFPMDVSSPGPDPDELGREYLQQEVYPTNRSSPIIAATELPVDPNLQAMINEAAAKYQDELRAKTIKKYQMAKLKEQKKRKNPPAPPAEPTKMLAPIGLIYLWTSQTFLDPLHMGECSLGFYITPEYRGKDCLVDATSEVVDLAFKDPECRRLQSIVVENPDKLYNLDLLARTGFRNEGIRRRAFFSSVACEWKDVTYFAMLVTDYVYDKNSEDSAVRLRPKSLWDEVFARHQKECDDLIRLEERSGLKRSCSIETIRERISASASYMTDSERADDMTDTASSVRSGASSKRRRMDGSSRSVLAASNSGGSISSGLDSEWEVSQPGISTQGQFFHESVVGTSTSGFMRARKTTSGARSGSSASSSWSLLSD
ncbi:hypothetical protein BDN70DRAFT_874703 [Pholiota conissans]|uniref:Uncharacterized protein n=1 Tax=Pholiota conissans TaxID=109636 RepID=A0A9P5Z6U5_9AGAR|nr:hypothetical protein BDN70DRAFT_874703 [Pholiota conissans]